MKQSGMLVVSLAALALGLAVAAPAIERDVLDSVAYLETGALSSDNVTVPCTLCVKSMTSLLEFCRDFEGKSMIRLSSFVDKCSFIGETELKEQDHKKGCSEETIKTRSRARMWNRKVRCLKIYTTLAETYSPFDPCTQIRNVVERAPMSICESRQLHCAPPPSDEDVDFVPPWARNATMAYEFPPLSCSQYAAHFVSECKQLKEHDFYARSNLDCDSMYSSKFQRMGCESVRQRMVAQDKLMDLCSSLYAKPLDVPVTTFCHDTLQLPHNTSVPIPAYESYLEKVRLFKEAWGSAGRVVGPQGPVFPVDEKPVPLPPTEQPPAAPQVVEEK